MTKTLLCGCVRGAFLCPTASALWERSSWALYEGNEAKAARLRELYEAHFEQQEPAPADDKDIPA